MTGRQCKDSGFYHGTSGSLLYTHKGWSYRPAYRVNALDTTGAGDSFMGALIYLLTHETDNIEELQRIGLGKNRRFL
ncbi:MAG: PfkB family carbohydrate kinase [Christensenellales bacterium]